MKPFEKTLALLIAMAMFVSLPGLSLAQEATMKMSPERKAKREARLKLIKDSAAALRQSNPALSKKLLEMTEPSKTKEVRGSPEWRAKREARIKTLKEASAALAQTNPDLSAGLEEMIRPKAK